MDLDKLADLVVLTVKNALAAPLERIALLERDNSDLRAHLAVVTELRDRVVIVETKAAQPVPHHQAVDFAPVLERVSATEARLAILGDVRDRVVAIESKSMASVVLEPVTTGPTAAEAELALRDRLEPLTKELAGVRERVIVLEARAPIPGPSGERGADGANGLNGTNGADGLGFDDLAVDFDGDRTLAVKFIRGDRVKSFPVTLPYQRNQGVYLDGKSYTQGDVVTWGGSQWHCNEDTTTKPGDGSKAWTLIVKRGRDGKDGKDAEALPVVRMR